MRILVLGGTRFLGRAFVELALAKSHDVTLFHRGQSGAELFDGQVERILGDRETDLGNLEGMQWDAVVDTCGYVPRIVQTSAQHFASGSPGVRYLFVSSISVYKDPAPGATEDWPVGTIDDPATEEITGGTYGPLKALCEAEVRTAFPDTHLVIRPGLIVGPHDPTDRFTYWPSRIAKGGDVLAPGRLGQPSQIVDVRDLAAFCVAALEMGLTGTYNVAAPQEPYQLGSLLEQIRDLVNPGTRLHWIDPEKLEEWGVKPWIEMPLYLGRDAKDDGAMAVSVEKAVAAGLAYRPLKETVRETLTWAKTRPADYEWKAGLPPAREAELLELWWS